LQNIRIKNERNREWNMAAQFLTERKANTEPRVASRGLPPVRLHHGRGSHSAVLQLQRILGNQRVARMIRGENISAGGSICGIQRKPAGSLADRQYEQEASPAASVTLKNAAGPGIAIRRKDTCSDSSSDEARWAGQNEGKIFKSGDNPKEPTEAILWNFCVGESQLREQHRLSLKQDTARWKGLLVGTGNTPGTRPELRIKIKGTASGSGNKAGNEKIALDRAQALKSFLESEGIPGSFITIEGLGSKLPLADETFPENMARNRRVELFFFTPTVTADITGALVAATVNKISMGKPSVGMPPPSFRKSANMFSRVHFAMTASADVELTGFSGDSIGFYQLLTGDQRIGLYTSEKDGSELLLDYGRCNTVLPCRDVLDATSSFSIDDRSLVLANTGSASGTVRISDRPGTGFPMRYPDTVQGPFVLSRYFWKMDFDLILGVRSGSLFMPLQSAAWSLAAAENVDVAKQTTAGMAPISVHQSFAPARAAGKKSEMDKAFASQTCRLMARSREVAPEELPCRPVET
jgi:outer membrane protein OmpA-like peptidoglycan-associated protein